MKPEVLEAEGIPGTLWVGLRPHATLTFYSSSWILQEGSPLRTRGEALGEERVWGDSRRWEGIQTQGMSAMFWFYGKMEKVFPKSSDYRG